MRLLIHLRWLLLLALGFGSSVARASHVLGGDIAYAPVASTTAGVPRYHVTVRLFRDVAGVDQPTIELICNQRGCNAAAADYFAVTIARTQNMRRTSLGCPTFTAFRVYDVFLYEVDVDLPRGQWTLSVRAENRNANIKNISNSASQAFYISAFLDNVLATQNNSPQFLTNLLPYLCGNAAQRYSFNTFDLDGDSLVYSFVTPQSAAQRLSLCSTPVSNYIPSQFQLNPATGALTTPAGPVEQGIYTVAARVNEYRRIGGTWQPIGYVTRDVAYLAYSSSNLPPRFTGLTLASGAARTFDQSIAVQPGQTVNLTLTAADPDAGQNLRFSSDATSVIPGLSLATLSATQARLTWQVPASLPLGRYTATVAVQDDGCPLNGSEEQTISFLVTSRVLASLPGQADAATTAFPMPFREQVQFQAAPGQPVSIVDELGRVVAQLRADASGRVQWQPAASLPAGLYLARGADGRPLARLLHSAN